MCYTVAHVSVLLLFVLVVVVVSLIVDSILCWYQTNAMYMNSDPGTEKRRFITKAMQHESQITTNEHLLKIHNRKSDFLNNNKK